MNTRAAKTFNREYRSSENIQKIKKIQGENLADFKAFLECYERLKLRTERFLLNINLVV